MKKNYNINDEWKLFYIKKLFDCHFCHYKHDKQIIEYLIKWIDYKLKFNEWYRKNFLDSAVKLILQYEIYQNSNSDWISYLHKLLVMSKTEFSDVSTNLLLKKQYCKLKWTAWYSFDIHVLNEARDSPAARMQLCSLILSAVWYHLQFDIVDRFDMICSLISFAVWYYMQFDIVYTHSFYFSYLISIVHLLVSIFLD